MNSNGDSALKVAEFLLQIKAIKLQPNKPFSWASGWNSPIYCDNRKALSHPKVRTYIRQQFADVISEKYGTPEAIAGVATGGIAWGALVAEALGVPFIYVRSSAKGHGLGNLIEGDVEEGMSVVVIEDLISTGGSSLKAVEALRAAKCSIKGMAAIFTYGFDLSVAAFEKENCQLQTLTDYPTLIKKAVEEGYVTESDVSTLEEWRSDPSNWGK